MFREIRYIGGLTVGSPSNASVLILCFFRHATVSFSRFHPSLLYFFVLCCVVQKLVAKADQLIKRRGKLNLVCVGKPLAGIKEWIAEKANKRCLVGATEGRLHTFIIEPFVPHTQVT